MRPWTDYSTLIFDLDGTLLSSASFILPIYKKIIAQYGGKAPDDLTMTRTFGLPDEQIWEILMPNSTGQIRRQAETDCGKEVAFTLSHCDILFPETRFTLEALKQAGYTLTTASNCGCNYLDAVLSTQHLDTLFTLPLCLESVHGKRKADILRAHCKVFDIESMVMIGDRQSDVEAAKEIGIPCIGCAFGFGHDDELTNADVIITNLSQLLTLFKVQNERP
ncbi:HAD family hydrolase [Alicyclobacillus tolerans]|nr:HAD family hydrolase [Alicyclobacillus montanus]